MVRTMAWTIAIAALLLAVSCTQTPEAPAPTAPTTAPPVSGPDPTVVDPDHYKTEFENDRVRILRIRYGPGDESVMHYHPSSVAVFLTELHVDMTLPDGSTEAVHIAARQHAFGPARLHQGRNAGSEPMEVLEIELKPGAAQPADPTWPDPVVVDPEHYQAEFENDQVRVLRITYGPGEASAAMHGHPDAVAVFFDDQQWELAAPDGTTEVAQFQAGQFLYMPAGQHLPKNAGQEPAELVLVELK